MNDQPLAFSSHEGQGDLEKQMPLESVEHVESPTPLPNAVQMPDLTLSQPPMPLKTADLYHGYLYTVVPKEFDIDAADITPEVQDFHPRKVWLWDTYEGLFNFDESLWKKIVVKIPREALGYQIFKETGDVYSISKVPVGWSKLQPTPPAYVE
jgi:hypothetical protein